MPGTKPKRFVLFVLATLSTCPAATSRLIAGPYSPSDGLHRYHLATGRPVVRTGSRNPVGVGWCTWFVQAVTPFALPARGYARNYYNPAFGQLSATPRPGSVAVWGPAVGRGCGHVGYVTAVDVEPGTFDVWDSNFSVGWDRRIRWRRHRSDDGKLLGFVLPPRPEVTVPPAVEPLPAEYELAFVRDGDLHACTLAEREVRRLTAGGGCAHPSWSADGRYLLFARDGNLVRLDTRTGRFAALTGAGGDLQPACHPSRALAWFVRLVNDRLGRPKRADLWRIGLDGRSPRRLGMVAPLTGEAADAAARTVWEPSGAMAAIEVPGADGPRYFDGEGRPLTAPGTSWDPDLWQAVPAWQPEGDLVSLPRPAWCWVRERDEAASS